MALVEVTIIPLGTETPSVSQYVARAVEALKDEENIRYEITAMGTIIEGKLEHLLSLVAKMHNAVFDAGPKRVVTTVKIDDRRDKSSSISSKIESLKRKTGNST